MVQLSSGLKTSRETHQSHEVRQADLRREPGKDEKVEVPILILQTPIRAKAQTTSSVNNETLTNVSFVQLIFPAEVGDYSKHIGMVIVVEGTLERGHKGDHFTDVVMMVKVVNPTAKPIY